MGLYNCQFHKQPVKIFVLPSLWLTNLSLSLSASSVLLVQHYHLSYKLYLCD